MKLILVLIGTALCSLGVYSLPSAAKAQSLSNSDTPRLAKRMQNHEASGRAQYSGREPASYRQDADKASSHSRKEKAKESSRRSLSSYAGQQKDPRQVPPEIATKPEYHNPNPLYPHGDSYDWRNDCNCIGDTCCCPCYFAGSIAKEAWDEWTGNPSHQSDHRHGHGKKHGHGSVAEDLGDVASSIVEAFTRL